MENMECCQGEHTHQLLQKKEEGGKRDKGRGGRGKWKKEKGLAAKQKCFFEDQRDILAQRQREWKKRDGEIGFH